MDGYLYHYRCPRWYGTPSGVRNLFLYNKTSHTKSPESIAKKDAEELTGSKTCDIQLIQKFSIMIQPLYTYTPIIENTLPGLSKIKINYRHKEAS